MATTDAVLIEDVADRREGPVGELRQLSQRPETEGVTRLRG